LHLDASSATPGPDGTDAVKKILGFSSIAVGVAELATAGVALVTGRPVRRATSVSAMPG